MKWVLLCTAVVRQVSPAADARWEMVMEHHTNTHVPQPKQRELHASTTEAASLYTSKSGVHHACMLSFWVVSPLCLWSSVHCQILSPDKTEWRLILATLCRWRRCFVADQLWFMACIWEEKVLYTVYFKKNLVNFLLYFSWAEPG